MCFSGLLGLHLLFKLSWPAQVLLTGMASTFSDWCFLLLGSGSLLELGLETQQHEGKTVGLEVGSAMGLWEQNLKGGTI